MKAKTFKTIIGILLMPLIFSLFLMDRILMLALFWAEVPSMKTWLVKEKLMMLSFWRVLFFWVVYGIIAWIKWII
jgi:hypothetical protein